MQKIIFTVLVIALIFALKGGFPVVNLNLPLGWDSVIKKQIADFSERLPADWRGLLAMKELLKRLESLRDTLLRQYYPKFFGLSATSTLEEIKKQVPLEELDSLRRKIITTPPLQRIEPVPAPTSTSGYSSASGELTRLGVINFTNVERLKQRVIPLIESEVLDQVAETKARDILAKQYFAHVSPRGIGAGNLADQFGYKYLLIGENLALGNFQTDVLLVKAWMDSPGHRANILNGTFRELGVGVAQGIYENREVWVGVQTFALPLSACPQPDSAVKAKIESLRSLIEARSKEADAKRTDIEASEPKYGSAYNAQIADYNETVAEINKLVEEAKILVEQYNNSVAAANTCMAQATAGAH